MIEAEQLRALLQACKSLVSLCLYQTTSFTRISFFSVNKPAACQDISTGSKMLLGPQQQKETALDQSRSISAEVTLLPHRLTLYLCLKVSKLYTWLQVFSELFQACLLHSVLSWPITKTCLETMMNRDEDFFFFARIEAQTKKRYNLKRGTVFTRTDMRTDRIST